MSRFVPGREVLTMNINVFGSVSGDVLVRLENIRRCSTTVGSWLYCASKCTLTAFHITYSFRNGCQPP